MAEEGIKILLAEDDRFLLEMYSSKFAQEKFRVVTAEDGESALKAAREQTPDIILLDVLMPKMDGFEVLKRLKADETTKGIPVIFLTNLKELDDVKAGMTMGAADYLIKPHTLPAEVVEKIKKILDK